MNKQQILLHTYKKIPQFGELRDFFMSGVLNFHYQPPPRALYKRTSASCLSLIALLKPTCASK